ncbi:hypothetical protein CWI39_0391p0020 [Hamiltosporidium magnivora]|uniref:PSD13 N-terminal domain-containing protein n=1 Tax=Hamiltosporidium magnivora TaxID=148818 RepID=A0A4Q9LHM3_9MICR|nr:hypothetical protein CWI39_0391p0020 [Hamiltosporidium magnivora]
MNQIETYFSQKKWYNLALSIEENLEKNKLVKEILLFIENKIFPVSKSFYPTTFASVVLSTIKHRNSIDLIEKAQELLRNDLLETETHFLAVDFLEIYRLEFMLLNGDKCHTQVYNFLEKKLKDAHNKKMIANLYRLSYEFYEIIGKYEEAYSYLIKYVEICGMPDYNERNYNISDISPKFLAEKMARLSLLSKDIHNYNTFYTSPIFPYLENKELSELYINTKQANISFLKKTNLITKYGLSIDGLIEKAHLISLLNYFFTLKSHRVRFDEAAKLLNIPKNNVPSIFLKSLSMKIVKGYIDCEKEEMVFTLLMCKILETKDIDDMINKFDSWRSKVRNVINTMDFGIKN